jgi:hypothetical protein
MVVPVKSRNFKSDGFHGLLPVGIIWISFQMNIDLRTDYLRLNIANGHRPNK